MSAPGLARRPAGCVVRHQPLDLGLRLVGQLEAVAAEDLDAVVGVRVVAGADDDARVRAHAHGEVRHGRAWGWGRTASRAPPIEQMPEAMRGLEHVAGEARVLADQDARARGVLPRPATKVTARPRAQRQLGRHRVLVGDAADAVGAEELRVGASSPWSGHRLQSCLWRGRRGREVSAGGVASDHGDAGVARGQLHRHRRAAPAVAGDGPRRAGRRRGRRPRGREAGPASTTRTPRAGRSGLPPRAPRPPGPRTCASVDLADARRDPHPRAALDAQQRVLEADVHRRPSTRAGAPSTETGSVKALSTSCTRLLGPAMRTSRGLARRPPPPRSPAAGRPEQARPHRHHLLQRALEVEGEDGRG